MATDQAEWLRLLKQEYLSEYIPEGGAAVKVVVTDWESVIPLVTDMVSIATDTGLLHFHVQASDSRVDMIQEIFFAVAGQIDWFQWADTIVRRLLNAQGMTIRNETQLSEVDTIAAENALTPGKLREMTRNLVTNSIAKDYSLAKDFRIALSALCAGTISPTLHSPEDCETLVKWLRGEKSDLKVLKNLLIFQRIGRHNARWMLNSLPRLAKKLGYQGVLVTLDINAIFESEEFESHAFHYSQSKILDFYEVLRQFIDDTDNSSHFAFVVIAPRAFVEDGKKWYKIYHALHTRLVDDVRDRERSNPLNALTVLSTEEN